MATGAAILCCPLFLFPFCINARTCFDFNKCKIINSLNQHNQHYSQPGCQPSVSSLSSQTKLCEGWTGPSGKAYRDFMGDPADNRDLKQCSWLHQGICRNYPIILIFDSYLFDSMCLFFRPLWVWYLVYCFESTRHSNVLFAYENDNKSKNYEYK